MADVPEPTIGASFEDKFSDGYEWRVAEHEDPSLIRLECLLDGEATGAVLDWPVNRWFALFEGKQMLVSPGDRVTAK
jgi:hypothetical protein